MVWEKLDEPFLPGWCHTRCKVRSKFSSKKELALSSGCLFFKNGQVKQRDERERTGTTICFVLKTYWPLSRWFRRRTDSWLAFIWLVWFLIRLHCRISKEWIGCSYSCTWQPASKLRQLGLIGAVKLQSRTNLLTDCKSAADVPTPYVGSWAMLWAK